MINNYSDFISLLEMYGLKDTTSDVRQVQNFIDTIEDKVSLRYGSIVWQLIKFYCQSQNSK